jgi:hypothetical protein
MFDYSGSTWENGERINQPSTETSWRDYPTLPDFIAEDDPYRTLCKLRREADNQFTVDHAELIADDLVTGFARNVFTDCWVPWLIRALNEMPDDVTADWKAAGIELGHRLWHATRDCEPRCHGYHTHEALEPFLHSHNVALLSKAEERESRAALGREIATEILEVEK